MKTMRWGGLLPTFRYVVLVAILIGALGAGCVGAGALPFLAARSARAAEAFHHALERRTGATGEILLAGEE
jgi:hypothetical protein